MKHKNESDMINSNTVHPYKKIQRNTPVCFMLSLGFVAPVFCRYEDVSLCLQGRRVMVAGCNPQCVSLCSHGGGYGSWV